MPGQGVDGVECEGDTAELMADVVAVNVRVSLAFSAVQQLGILAPVAEQQQFVPFLQLLPQRVAVLGDPARKGGMGAIRQILMGCGLSSVQACP
ncbi:hypothetical protein OR1_00295 [Geobacter sp. OR-1]|nr:hypothetical protein OR1_00295 [Geobacter sp. OR-1]